MYGRRIGSLGAAITRWMSQHPPQGDVGAMRCSALDIITTLMEFAADVNQVVRHHGIEMSEAEFTGIAKQAHRNAVGYHDQGKN